MFSFEPERGHGISARDFIRLPLPEFCLASDGHRTLKPSGSGYSPFEGDVYEWSGFKASVRRFCDRSPPNEVELSRESPHSVIDQETYMCAAEKGVEGRFTQRALHVMNHVMTSSNVRAQWTDWKACSTIKGPARTESLDPDYSLVAPGRKDRYELRCVGEIKADWKNAIIQNTTIDANGKYNAYCPLRKYIGQPAQYMATYRLKYGFITTYTNTIFICMPQHVNKHAISALDRLYVSPAINCGASRTAQDPMAITLREAFWWITHLALEDHVSKPRRVGRGVGPSPAKSTKAGLYDDPQISSDFDQPPVHPPTAAQQPTVARFGGGSRLFDTPGNTHSDVGYGQTPQYPYDLSSLGESLPYTQQSTAFPATMTTETPSRPPRPQQSTAFPPIMTTSTLSRPPRSTDQRDILSRLQHIDNPFTPPNQQIAPVSADERDRLPVPSSRRSSSRSPSRADEHSPANSVLGVHLETQRGKLRLYHSSRDGTRVEIRREDIRTKLDRNGNRCYVTEYQNRRRRLQMDNGDDESLARFVDDRSRPRS